MEAERKKIIASDDGFSLVELIVSVLVSGIVMLAVMGFLTSGLRHYRNVNSETLLQMESQMTELFITELMQESSSFKMVDGSDLPTGVTAALEVQRGTDYFVLAHIGNELRFGQTTAGSTAERVEEIKDADRKTTFLAQYVTDFSLPTARDSFEKVRNNVANYNDYYGTSVTIEYQVDQKTYTSSSLIRLQNVERN